MGQRCCFSISTLEKRLEGKIEECEDVQAQLRRQKDLVQQHQTAAQREKTRADRIAKLGGGQQKIGSEEASDVNDVSFLA